MNSSKSQVDKLVIETKLAADKRSDSYRERALKIYPWICGRCAREFSGKNLRELTVHHRDHNHDNNPVNGNNWELLCIYCHDNEHQRVLESENSTGNNPQENVKRATYSAFADLKSLLNNSNKTKK